MRRALGAFLALVALGGCARPAPARQPVGASDGSAATEAVDLCATTEPRQTPHEPIASLEEPPWGERVARVEISGARRIDRALLESELSTRVGDALDADRMREDVLGLHALEALEEVRAEVETTRDGLVLRFVVRERALVDRVEYRGVAPEKLGRVTWFAPGELYDRARIERVRSDLQTVLEHSGHLRARVSARSRARGGHAEICFAAEPGPRFVVDAIRIPGAAAVPERELLALIDTRDGRANRRGAPYRADLLAEDQPKLAALYYDRGFVQVEIGEPRAVLDERNRRVRIEIPVTEGRAFAVGDVRFGGRLLARADRYRRLLGVARGERFSRAKLAEGLERIRSFHRERGAPAEPVPETTLVTESARVDLLVTLETP